MTDQNQEYALLLKRAMATIANLKDKVAHLEKKQSEPIAVIGMGCRLPGESDSPEEFWQLLRDGLNAAVEIPNERWHHDEIYSEDPETPGAIYTRKAALIKDVDKFDPMFFGISPRESMTMDPQQRLLLEVVWEAMEYGGLPAEQLRHSSTGVFIGNSFLDYQLIYSRHARPEDVDIYFSTGNSSSVLSGRISYLLGLNGPSLTMDTACSSSLMATHMACQSLRRGECDMAFAGAANLILDPSPMIGLSRARMLAADGMSKAFDDAANGYGRGEGVGIVLLKRLSDAERDNDRILAVILGSATNQDGASKGLTVPNGDAQEASIRAALADARVAPGAVNYIEAHGTGTPVGDPIEVTAIGNVFAAELPAGQRLPLGSVKTNIGHLEAAAGVAGLLKVILSIQHKQLPPHHSLRTRSSQIPWDEIPLDVLTELTPWEPDGGARRVAGINSFGFSGSNVHLIVAEPEPKPQPVRRQRNQQLLTISAKNSNALQELAERYRRFLDTTADSLADIAFTTHEGRDHFRERLTLLATDKESARKRLSLWLEKGTSFGVNTGTAGVHPRPLAFLFTGQGAQYAGMGQKLYDDERVYREAIDQCAQILADQLPVPLLSVMFPTNEDDHNLIDQTEYTQPALFAQEYAMAKLWQSWGIEPSVVMGHSVGEYVAACIAGVFSLEDGLKLIAARGRLMGALPAGGTMAAILADAESVEAAVAPHRDVVSIAAYNGPNSIVISGEEAAVNVIVAEFRAVGKRVVPLTVSHAFHSPLMSPMLAEFRAIVKTIALRPPSLWLISNLTGRLVSDEVTDSEYWVQHVREAVRFEPAMQTLLDEGYQHFLEVGPQPTLLGMGRRCLPAGSGSWIPSLKKGQEDQTVVLQSLGQLFVAGFDVDWQTFNVDGKRQKVTLPTYAFQRQSYWHPFVNGLRKDTGQQTAHWERVLLGQKLRTPTVDGTIYHTPLSIHSPAHLDGHRIYGYPLFPAAGFIEMGLQAAREELGGESVAVENFSIHEALILPEEGSRSVQLISENAPDGLNVTVYSEAEDGWKSHFAGKATAPTKVPSQKGDLEALKARFKKRLDGVEFYQRLADDGYDYGPDYQAIQEIYIGDHQSFARAELPKNLHSEATEYEIHPSMLDAILQPVGLLTMLSDIYDVDSLFLPVYASSVELYRPGQKYAWIHSQITHAEGEIVRSDCDVYADDGTLILHIEQFVAKRARKASLKKLLRRRYDSWFYDLSWKLEPAGLLQKQEPGRWLILADCETQASDLCQSLEAQGHEVSLVLPAAQGAKQAKPGVWHIDLSSRSTAMSWLTTYIDASTNPYHGAICLWGFRQAEPTQAEAIQLEVKNRAGRALNLMQGLLSVANGVLNAENGPRLFLVTANGQAVAGAPIRSPLATSLWGLGRTAMMEHAELRVLCVDLADDVSAAAALLQEIGFDSPENQIAWHPDGRFVGRITHPAKEVLPLPDTPQFALAIPKRGTLENLTINGLERRQPEEGQVEIKVRASGLNFRDVLNVLDMYPGDPGAIGGECAGTIVAVGQGVTRFKIGDDVMAIASGTFRSHVVVQAEHVFPKPKNLTFAESATIPITFLTAYYGLHHLACMKANDKILIHAAAGGVGMAAVQLIKQVGAEIFGTAWCSTQTRSPQGYGCSPCTPFANVGFC